MGQTAGGAIVVRRDALSEHVLAGAILGAVALLAALRIAYPLDGDQALFTLGAMKMHAGAVLYRDFWDLKQPGIYLFYAVGGALFGYTAVGIHVFELLYLLVFSAVLQHTLRPFFRTPFVSAAAPLLTVGFYYANATPFSLTQAEAVAGFPLYLCAYWALTGAEKKKGRASRLFGAAVAGSVALAIKLIFLPLVLAILAGAIVSVSGSQMARDRADLFKAAVIMVLELSLVTGLWLAVTAAVCGWQIVSATFFIYPLQIAHNMQPAPLRRLLASIVTYGVGVLPLLAGAGVILRARQSLRNPIVAVALTWIAAALLTILLQRESWWEYQFELLTVPLGILGALGIEQFCLHVRAARGRRVSIAVAAIVMAVLAAVPLMRATVAMRHLEGARHGFHFNVASFQAGVDGGDWATSETAFLRQPTALPGPIYVCGNPRYYFAADRTQNVSITGWALELLTPGQWSSLRAQIQKAHPSYIFVSTTYRRLIAVHSRDLGAVLRTRYRLMRHDSLGDWYRERTSRTNGGAT